jgi:CDP-diacylglycerol--serine O-phosphatidyltransferase
VIRNFQLADFFTLGNAGWGVAAVFFAMLYLDGRIGGSFL